MELCRPNSDAYFCSTNQVSCTRLGECRALCRRNVKTSIRGASTEMWRVEGGVWSVAA
jgi:hypothetical protein